MIVDRQVLQAAAMWECVLAANGQLRQRGVITYHDEKRYTDFMLSWYRRGRCELVIVSYTSATNLGIVNDLSNGQGKRIYFAMRAAAFRFFTGILILSGYVHE